MVVVHRMPRRIGVWKNSRGMPGRVFGFVVRRLQKEKTLHLKWPAHEVARGNPQNICYGLNPASEGRTFNFKLYDLETPRSNYQGLGTRLSISGSQLSIESGHGNWKAGAGVERWAAGFASLPRVWYECVRCVPHITVGYLPCVQMDIAYQYIYIYIYIYICIYIYIRI
jgi:hypothetical protein